VHQGPTLHSWRQADQLRSTLTVDLVEDARTGETTLQRDPSSQLKTSFQLLIRTPFGLSLLAHGVDLVGILTAAALSNSAALHLAGSKCPRRKAWAELQCPFPCLGLA
jgi:hypothetical protein